MMRRRNLLLSGAASFLATLSSPALATKETAGLTDADVEKIARAFRVVEDYRFELHERAQAFGIKPDTVKTLEELRTAVHGTFKRSADLVFRIECLVTVRQKMDNRFGEYNIADQLDWLGRHTPSHSYGSGLSCLGVMKAGEILRFENLLGAMERAQYPQNDTPRRFG